MQRNLKLVEMVKSLNCKYLHGEGKSANDDWEGEASLLILNLDKQAACEIGNIFKQNALLWCAYDAIPQIILLR